MIKSKEEIKKFIENAPLEELKALAFTYLMIKNHLKSHMLTEKRKREQLRLKIADRTTDSFYNQYNS